MDCFVAALLAMTGAGSEKLRDDLNLTYDRFVESSQLLRWNPIFRVRRAAGLLGAVIVQKTPSHLEARHVAGAAGRQVPVAGNLYGIFFRQHRIKDWLVRKPWRECAHAALSDQIQLGRPNRTPERYDVVAWHLTPAVSRLPRSTATSSARSRTPASPACACPARRCRAGQ